MPSHRLAIMSIDLSAYRNAESNAFLGVYVSHHIIYMISCPVQESGHIIDVIVPIFGKCHCIMA